MVLGPIKPLQRLESHTEVENSPSILLSTLIPKQLSTIKHDCFESFDRREQEETNKFCLLLKSSTKGGDYNNNN